MAVKTCLDVIWMCLRTLTKIWKTFGLHSHITYHFFVIFAYFRLFWPFSRLFRQRSKNRAFEPGRIFKNGNRSGNRILLLNLPWKGARMRICRSKRFIWKRLREKSEIPPILAWLKQAISVFSRKSFQLNPFGHQIIIRAPFQGKFNRRIRDPDR